ncbi:cytochrome P450 [Mucidula mucida]|nr:cytochrome P450 [Mucidula mucida]
MSLTVVVGLFLLAAALVLRPRRTKTPCLPPGPRRLPVIGNLLDRPSNNAWLTYTKWAKEHDSDVISFEVLGRVTVVLSSATAVKELLERRSSIYSDRPSMRMLNELMRWDWNFGFMPYADSWRLHRKAFSQHFNVSKIAQYRPVQVRSTAKLLHQMLESPGDFFAHIRHHSGSIIFSIVYGYEMESTNDPLVEMADRAMKASAHAMSSGNHLVDYLPILRYVPSWCTFKKDAELAAHYGQTLRDVPFNRVLEAMADDRAPPSFVATSIQRILHADMAGPRPDQLEVIKNCAAVSFVGGADTTVALILTILLAMVLHPEVQSKAQAELDIVVGRNRLPTYDDRQSLPFLDALILESMRWRPVGPLPISHANLCDDGYDGYFIPKGSTISANVWAIMHDEKMFPAPDVFDPERFLGEHPQPDPTTLGAWGFGRRICSGRYLAMDTVYITIASLLWAFTFGKARNKDGQAITPDDQAYTEVFIMHPLPFECLITSRFSGVEHVLDSLVVG